MRKLLMLLTFCATLGAGYWLGRFDRDRAETSTNSLQDVSAQSRITWLEAERERLQGDVRTLQQAAPHAEQAPRDPKHALPGAGSIALDARVSGRAESLTDRLSPDHQRILARQRYGHLFRELALSESQIEAVLPVLSAQDRGATPFGARQATPQEEQERDKEIAAAIGADKAAQFSSLRKSMPARMEARLLREELDMVGEPLSDDQQRQLAAELKDIGLPVPPMPAEGEPPRDMGERFRSWRREREQLVHDRAAAVLTPLQLKRLEENQSVRLAIEASLPRGFGVSAPPAPRNESPSPGEQH